MDSNQDKEFTLFILRKLNRMLKNCETFDGLENKIIDLIKELTEEYLPGRTIVIVPEGIETIIVSWTCPACEYFNEFRGNSGDINWRDNCKNCELEFELRPS